MIPPTRVTSLITSHEGCKHELWPSLTATHVPDSVKNQGVSLLDNDLFPALVIAEIGRIEE